MSIRKLMLAVVICLSMFTSGVCFARISVSDLSIGGVYLNQKFSDVISIYGKPVRERIPAGYGKIYSFARGASIFDIHVTRDNVVKGVTICGNNGLAMDSSGIQYGSSLNDVIKYYGYPDQTTSLNNNTGLVLEYYIRNQGVTQELLFYIGYYGTVTIITYDEVYG